MVLVCSLVHTVHTCMSVVAAKCREQAVPCEWEIEIERRRMWGTGKDRERETRTWAITRRRIFLVRHTLINGDYDRTKMTLLWMRGQCPCMNADQVGTCVRDYERWNSVLLSSLSTVAVWVLNVEHFWTWLNAHCVRSNTVSVRAIESLSNAQNKMHLHSMLSEMRISTRLFASGIHAHVAIYACRMHVERCIFWNVIFTENLSLVATRLIRLSLLCTHRHKTETEFRELFLRFLLFLLVRRQFFFSFLSFTFH